jgi:hypothetical protein
MVSAKQKETYKLLEQVVSPRIVQAKLYVVVKHPGSLGADTYHIADIMTKMSYGKVEVLNDITFPFTLLHDCQIISMYIDINNFIIPVQLNRAPIDLYCDNSINFALNKVLLEMTYE